MIDVENLNIYVIKMKTGDRNIHTIKKKVKNAKYLSFALYLSSYFSEINAINSFFGKPI